MPLSESLLSVLGSYLALLSLSDLLLWDQKGWNHLNYLCFCISWSWGGRKLWELIQTGQTVPKMDLLCSVRQQRALVEDRKCPTFFQESKKLTFHPKALQSLALETSCFLPSPGSPLAALCTSRALSARCLPWPSSSKSLFCSRGEPHRAGQGETCCFHEAFRHRGRLFESLQVSV